MYGPIVRNTIITSILAAIPLLGCTKNLKTAENFYTMENNAKTFVNNGIAIRYFEFGNGKPIIFLHGFGVSSYSWRYISEYFKSKYQIILIDLKGFGLSDKPIDYHYSILDQAEVIFKFIKGNSIQNACLVGHSLGGAIALATYIKIHEAGMRSIEKLILIDSAGDKQKVPGFIALLQTPIINHISFLTIPSHVSTKIVLKKVFFEDSKITDEVVKTYASYVELPGARHAFIETAKQISPKNFRGIVQKFKNIEIPVLIIWGKEDEIVPLSVGKKLESEIPNSQLIIIPQTGHAPHEENPSETIKIISDFLKSQNRHLTEVTP
jgi:pimeloyl-ACP methyl ester carboxylesterase